MKREHIIIMVLAIIILVGTGIYAYNYIQEKAYFQGVQDTELFFNEQIKNQLESQGYIVYNYQVNETTIVPIQLGLVKGGVE